MKFELSRPTDYSDEAFLNEIRRVADLVAEKPLTITKFDKNSKYNSSTISKRFGSWLSALEKAGLDKTYWHIENRKISTEEIVTELKRVAEILKSTSFTRSEFVENSSMTKFIFKGDNSFNKIMKLAGLDVPLISRKYEDAERFENLLNVWTYYGRQPKYAEMKVSPSVVGPKAYVIRWGSWTNALLAFIEKVNSDINQEVVEIEEKNINTTEQAVKKRIAPEDRREIPIGLRYDILKRDKFCCVICGAMPKTHNISLEVDHILAWANGGKTNRLNLRTLCNKCNNGKSDKTE